MKKTIRYLTSLVLILSVTGCGGTQIKIINSSNNNYNNVIIRKSDSNTEQLEFGQINKNTSTEEKDWDLESLIVKVITESPSTSDETGSITLIEGETNIITIRDGSSSSAIVYTVETE